MWARFAMIFYSITLEFCTLPIPLPLLSPPCSHILSCHTDLTILININMLRHFPQISWQTHSYDDIFSHNRPSKGGNPGATTPTSPPLPAFFWRTRKVSRKYVLNTSHLLFFHIKCNFSHVRIAANFSNSIFIAFRSQIYVVGSIMTFLPIYRNQRQRGRSIQPLERALVQNMP